LENRFPLRAIDRIEIIRGPGSARYGGYAELAVIKIISRGAALKGVDLSGTYGHMQRGFGRALGEFNIGNTIAGGFLDGLSFAVGAYGGEAARSDQMFNDGYGNAYRMNWENQATSPTWMNLQLDWGGFHMAALVDAYRVRQRDAFDVSSADPINTHFYSAHVDLSYSFKAGDWFELTPRLLAKRQLPWFSGSDFGQYLKNDQAYFKTADRVRPSLTMELRPLDGLQITAGLESIVDYGRVYPSPDGVFGEGLNTLFVDANNPDGAEDVLYWVVAGYLETTLINPIANITAGARFEFHNRTGPSFVPRFALTKSFGALWGKLLLSAAYKQPGIENFNANPDVLSENTTVYEAEVGYALTNTTTIAASLYRIEIQRPIVYGIVDGVETYANFDKTGAQGVELELRMQESWGTLTGNYSFTNSAGLNGVSVYEGITPGSLRGVAGHKLTGSAGLRLSSNVTLGPSLVVLSERAGWLGSPDGAQGTSPPVVLANLSLTYRDMFTEGLDGTLAVYNILDSDYRYIQPYDGGHMPLPTPGRELLLRFAYHFPF
jgi:outer membrane cobalamin receptor